MLVTWALSALLILHPNPAPSQSSSLAKFQRDGNRLHPGQVWIATRTIHFVSVADQIDQQNDDRFKFEILSDQDGEYLQVSRWQTGTHVANGDFVPSPPGEPEQWRLPIDKDGTLSMPKVPVAPLESILAEIIFSAWNGKSASPLNRRITLDQTGANRLSVKYDETPDFDTVIEGVVDLDPQRRFPTHVDLDGRHVQMPSSAFWLSMKATYTVRSKS
jgi:hypothetical protein